MCVRVRVRVRCACVWVYVRMCGVNDEDLLSGRKLMDMGYKLTKKLQKKEKREKKRQFPV